MLNHITIMGRLVRDPELRHTQSGIPVCTFRIANDRDYISQGGERETDFFDVTAWRGVGEFVSKYFTKGRMITVDGQLQTRNWTDRDGNRRVSVGICAIAIGNPPLLPSSCENSSQSGFSPASHRACDFHRTRRSINAD